MEQETFSPDLSEARRLLDAGLHLVKLKPHSKQPQGDDWNAQHNRALYIDPSATGYGLPLASNHACSVDPDNWPLAVRGMRSLGFDLEAIMAAGVRTTSTRPGSGGRSAFAEEPDLSWLKFSSRDPQIGTVIEFRASSSNLQDVVPGLVYFDKSGAVRTQAYANAKRLDDLPGLPDELMVWWQRCSADIDFLRQQQDVFMKAIGAQPILSISTGKTGHKLAFDAPGYRGTYNAQNRVEDILDRHGYSWHPSLKRWAPPTASGAPGVRLIPGKTDLWTSDHASDPLCGTFDAWVAHVALDHFGDVDKAKREMAKSEFVNTPMGVPSNPTSVAAHVQVDHKNHPLAKYVRHDDELLDTNFVIEGLIQEGVVFVGGQEATGKTTAFVPLMMAAAGFHDEGYEFGPKQPDRWRHVIYITEDIKQAQRVLTAMRRRIGLTRQQVEERFHLVEAVRMGAMDFVTVKDHYMQLVASQSGVDLLPVVVCDTKSAVFTIDDENDNAAASALIATLKQQFNSIPLIIIGHLAKAEITRTNASQMSIRGAGAVGGDAHQTLFLVREGETRWLLQGKSRFESPYKELEIESFVNTTLGINRWGEAVEITVRAGIAKVPNAPRQGRDKDGAAARARATARMAVMDIVQQYVDQGERINRAGVKAEAGMKGSTVVDAIEQLLAENWLVEIEIPIKERLNNNKKMFLVRLTDTQREAFIKTGVLPPEITWIPSTWKKDSEQQIPSVPKGSARSINTDDFEGD